MSLQYLNGIESEAKKLSAEAGSHESAVNKLKGYLRGGVTLPEVLKGLSVPLYNESERLMRDAIHEVLEEMREDVLRRAVLKRLRDAKGLRMQEKAKRQIITDAIIMDPLPETEAGARDE